MSRYGAALVVVLSVLAVGCSDDSIVAPMPSAPSRQAAAVATSSLQPVPGSYIVLMKPGAQAGALRAGVSAAGATVSSERPQVNVMLVSGLSEAQARALAARPDVRAIVPDRMAQWIPPNERNPGSMRRVTSGRVSPLGTDQSSAFFFPEQWNLRVIKAPQAWRETPSGAGTLVCILDSGVDPEHIDLAGKVDRSKSKSFVPTEKSIQDFLFHGTFVSSIVATNGIGIASVAPDATLCAVKVLNEHGSGAFSWIIDGMIFAADEGADVINMSLGLYINKHEDGVPQLIEVLTEVVAYVRSKGTQVVAAAGNEGVNLDEDDDFIELPAEIPGVISVAATGPLRQRNFDRLASYSNRGGRRGGVDIAAPGGDFVSDEFLFDLVLGACARVFCGDESSYLLGDGTSFAAPHVSGAGAVADSNNPADLGAAQLDFCILHGADKILTPSGTVDTRYGAGRLNVLRSARLCAGDLD
ncbi:MAG TPA: S8 family serine peptidase [Gemmatimonadaceae bacterium]|nr:S8 family serine peptidase [Gemmatimonadaceae bacterium]